MKQRMTNKRRWPAVEMVVRADGRVLSVSGLERRGMVWSGGDGYRLESRRGGDVIEVGLGRSDGRAMAVESVEVRFTLPFLHFSKVILPDGGREYIFRDRALFLRSQVTQVTAANDGHPFAALTDQTGSRTWAFGPLTFWRESTCQCVDPQLSARKAMRGGHDLLTLAFRLPTAGWRYGTVAEVRERFFCSEREETWFHALRRYAARVRRGYRVRYPRSSAAWDPVWCTWTAWCSDRMGDETVRANARVAKALGIRTIILDDGWFGPGLDTDDRPLTLGDYEPDPAKFPDLAGTIRVLQREGLAVLLWYAPTCLSPDSRAYSRWKDHRIFNDGKPVLAPNGFYNLCPCDPEVRDYVQSEIVRMITAYGPDGFKVDLYNTLPTTPCTGGGHRHDTESVVEGVRRMEAAIWEEVRSRCPRGLLELKQNYGNILSAQYGTMVRTGDTAYDVDTNFHRCLYLQACVPVVHNDYFAGSVLERPRDLAVMMIKMVVGGVPTFSLDLVRQRPETLAVLKGWLDFYHAHRSLWKGPREPLDRRLESWRIGRGRVQVVAALFGTAELRLPAADSIWVLNGTAHPFVYGVPDRPGRYEVKVYDLTGRLERTGTVDLALGSRLAVPSGGRVLLTAKQGKEQRP